MAESETKQDLIAAAKQLGPTEGAWSLVPRSFEEAYRFANFLADSTIIPKDFQKNPANVMVAMQFGMELGVNPMQALQSIYVINGRPAIYGDLPLAIVYRSGELVAIEEEGDEHNASCKVKREGYPAITRTFSMDDAKRAKLTERNPTYQTYPKRMLQLRARALALRDAFPDVLKGIAIAEEQEEADARDVTPRLKIPEAKHEEKSRADQAGPRDKPDSVEDNKLAAKGARAKARKDSAPGPAEQPETAAEAAFRWCRETPDAEFFEQRLAYLKANLNKIPTDRQRDVLVAFNDRVHAITEALKKNNATTH